MAEITDFGPRKTIFILAIVAGCFAVLWPKIFYPMLTASVTPQHSPDNSACCDVIFVSDVTAADIMHEICQNIMKHHQVDPRVRDALKNNKLTPQTASLCREEVLTRCGIDLSTFLAQRERIGKSYKQVLEEIRTVNSSLCLKINFGIPLSQLGIPHLIRYHILMPHSTIRQERRTPPHAGGLHPALRERGRAIPSSHIVPKVVDRPDQVIPKMRPPLGGAGHVVSAPKGNGTMGIIMPLYTFGIVLFFLYTIVKVLKKNSDSEIISEYAGADAEKEFRKMVFNPETLTSAMTAGAMSYKKERSPSPHLPPPTLEELKDLDGAPKSNGLAGVNRTHKEDTAAQDRDSKAEEELENLESPTVKVMGMEMTASCEGGQKGSRPTTPIIPTPPSHMEREKTPPKPIYLEGALPSQCELLVTDSETQAQKAEEDAEAPVVLSGKMTLSLISLDQIAAESEDESLKIADAEEEDENLEVEAAEEEDIKEVLTLETGVERTPNQKLFEAVKMAEREDEEEIEVEDEDEEEDEEVEVEEMEEDINELGQDQHSATEKNVDSTVAKNYKNQEVESVDDAEEDEEYEEEVEEEEDEEEEVEVEEIEVDDDEVEEEEVEIEIEEEVDEEAEDEAEEEEEEEEVEDEEIDEAYHDKAVKNRLTTSSEEESEVEDDGDERTGLPYSKKVNPNKRD